MNNGEQSTQQETEKKAYYDYDELIDIAKRLPEGPERTNLINGIKFFKDGEIDPKDLIVQESETGGDEINPKNIIISLPVPPSFWDRTAEVDAAFLTLSKDGLHFNKVQYHVGITTVKQIGEDRTETYNPLDNRFYNLLSRGSAALNPAFLHATCMRNRILSEMYGWNITSTIASRVDTDKGQKNIATMQEEENLDETKNRLIAQGSREEPDKPILEVIDDVDDTLIFDIHGNLVRGNGKTLRLHISLSTKLLYDDNTGREISRKNAKIVLGAIKRYKNQKPSNTYIAVDM